MPDSTPANTTGWRILTDVNAHEEVDRFFLDTGADGISAKRIFDKGTPDDLIDEFARENGCIIVSHDRQFMKLIQRRVYQRNISAETGYGRILLCGTEKRQANRLLEILPILTLYRRWAIDTDHRFIVTVGDNWVRIDDKPIARVIRETPAIQ